LEQLRVNQLFAKQSKYTFCGKKVEYFGHIISGNVVVIDPKKTAAIQEQQSKNGQHYTQLRNGGNSWS
jgi:hypothetical protein